MLASVASLAVPAGWARAFAGWASAGVGLACLLLVVATLAGIAVWGLVRHFRNVERSEIFAPIVMPAIVAVGVIGAVILFYLVGHSPRHAMGPKYFAIALPALVVAFGVLSRSPRLQPVVIGVLSFQLVVAISLVRKTHRSEPCSIGVEQPLVTERASRGELVGLLWCVEPERMVLVSNGRVADGDLAGVEEFVLFNSSDGVPPSLREQGYEPGRKQKLSRAHGWLIELRRPKTSLVPSQ